MLDTLDFTDQTSVLSNDEIEEMEAAMADRPVSDEDWNWYFEATHSDPMEWEDH